VDLACRGRFYLTSAAVVDRVPELAVYRKVGELGFFKQETAMHVRRRIGRIEGYVRPTEVEAALEPGEVEARTLA